ncbi:NADPH-dependent FMN reductase [Fulvivirga kasyanovii]|uniref:NAD(P)H-dependent oxidoreductase n=1 Tax=Fulvivirga kasyanovii TaxID=396812 RepID=A0ABW9RY82_9BACT|nr:NAD(P)H-dependent oxidoreductase [Fulvivirga kasyanovii]MTI27975.1 NAD(P)H-dependent oxidoreductase [Fulvivirga kasyanovii]
MKKKILAISGSTRKQSSNEAILQVIADWYKDELDVQIYDGIDKLPHFNPDLAGENSPEVVKEFQEQIKNADGVLICTPEYVFSLPGSLKNAIEWNVATTIFSGKPLATIVASASGEKAFKSLNLIMTTLECSLPEDSRLLIRGVRGKIKDGEITDEDIISQLKNLVNSLIASIEMAEQEALGKE